MRAREIVLKTKLDGRAGGAGSVGAVVVVTVQLLLFTNRDTLPMQALKLRENVILVIRY